MSLLQMSFYASVMIVSILIVRFLFKNRLPKETFLVLWGIVLLRLLCPFQFSSPYSIYSKVDTEVQMMQKEGFWNFPVMATDPTINVNNGQVAHSSFTSANYIWLAGFLLCAAYFVVVYVHCIREFRKSLPISNSFLRKWLETHKLHRNIQIRQSDKINAPISYGIIRPVILLPKGENVQKWNSMDYILEHEFVHIRRFDQLSKLLMIAALCVHWFNPVVWMMYVVFNRDIELSCDEAVVRRFGIHNKKTYAMTLIGMEEVKSGLTPFYNGFSKNAIEERVKSIMKTRKHRFIAVLAAVVLIVGISVCFATSSNHDSIQANEVENDKEKEVPKENIEAEFQDTDTEASSQNVREETTNIQCMLEGMLEEMPATLYVGNGFSIYIPDDGWQIYDETIEEPGQMVAVYSSTISIDVSHYKDESMPDVQSRYLTDGYAYDEYNNKNLKKIEGEAEKQLMYVARIGGQDKDVWVVEYRFPANMEWQPRLEAIADTFAITENTSSEEMDLSADAKAIQTLATNVSKAYFMKDTDAIKEYLTTPYDWDIGVYQGDADVVGYQIKGLDNIENQEIGDICTVSVEYMESDDTLKYLTIEFVKQSDGWKVSFYGLEG